MPEDQQDSGEFRRRLPSVPRSIGEIKPDDLRVSLIGTVIDKHDQGLIVDDGTGRMRINFDSPLDAEINNLVRILGRVVPMEGGIEMHGEFIQDMSGLDIGLLRKVNRL